MFKQLTLITDGESNLGMPPDVAAQEAYNNGIIVNVIGIIDHHLMSGKAITEIKDIARLGGGISQIVQINKLAETIHMVTKRAIETTVQQVVNVELKKILGIEGVNQLTPEKRIYVTNMMEELGENSPLSVLLLIDTSISMQNKIDHVKRAIDDFLQTILARRGKTYFAVATYPSDNQYINIIFPWDDNLNNLNEWQYSLKFFGLTPTGEALKEAHNYFFREEPVKQGLLNQYVI